MPAYDKLYSVVLLPIMEKRLEQERIAQEARQKVEQERLDHERIAAEQQAKKEAEQNAKTEAGRKEEIEKKVREEAERQARLGEEKRKMEDAEKERIERERKEREQAEEKKRICRTVSDSLVFNIKGVEFKMVNVEGGSFWMGAQKADSRGQNYDDEAWDGEKPVHKVTLSSFYIGEVEVTQALWKTVMGTTVKQQRDKFDPKWPIRGEGDDYPMYYVNWNECQEFIKKLNEITGKSFRLPTEAEWEYASRGGKKSLGYKYSGSNTIGGVAWYKDNSGYTTHPVKGKKPNELGLYDMSGNVEEWCQDLDGTYSGSEQTNPNGYSSGSFRVLRGGSWICHAVNCRVSVRDSYYPNFRYYSYGFRLVLPQ